MGMAGWLGSLEEDADCLPRNPLSSQAASSAASREENKKAGLISQPGFGVNRGLPCVY
jgi:hypothetical protein